MGLDARLADHPPRQRLLAALGKRLSLIARLATLAAVLWTLLLPLAFARRQFYDEHALLGPYTPVTFTNGRLVTQLRSHFHPALPTPELLALVCDLASRWDVPAIAYNFQHKETFGIPAENGTNVVVTVHSRRGTRAEALLVIVPLDDRPEQRNATASTVAMAMAVIQHLSDVPWLAHDVLWLFAWPRVGAQHYAHVLAKSSAHIAAVPPAVIPAAVVRAAISLELTSYRFRRLIGVGIEGVNGQLPNEDVMHAAHDLIRREGFVATQGALLPDVGPPGPIFAALHWAVSLVKPDASAPEAWRLAAGLWRHLLVVASGVPGGQHAPFREANVHGVTLANSPHDIGARDIPPHVEESNLRSIGRIVEGYLRCMNNLSEQLHASFFLYFVLSPERFIGFDIVNVLVWVAAWGVMADTLAHNGAPALRLVAASAGALLALSLGAVLYAVPLLLMHTSPLWQAAGVLASVWCCGAAYHFGQRPLTALVFGALGLPRPATPDAHVAHRVLCRCMVQVVLGIALTVLTVWNPALCLLASLYAALYVFLGTPVTNLYPARVQPLMRWVHLAAIALCSIEGILLLAALGGGDGYDWVDGRPLTLRALVRPDNLAYVFLTTLAFPLRLTAFSVHTT